MERRLKALGRGQQRVRLLRPLAGPDQPLGRARVARPLQVERHPVWIWGRFEQQGFGDPPVPQSLARWRQAFVQRLTDERMGKAHGQAVGRCLQQPGVDSRVDDVEQVCLGRLGHRAQQPQRNLLTDDRRDLEGRVGRIAESLQAAFDDFAQERRHGRLVQLAECPRLVALLEEALFFQRSQQLADIQRIAVRVLFQIGDKPRLVRFAECCPRGDERAHGVGLEPPQVETNGSTSRTRSGSSACNGCRCVTSSDR